MGVIVKKCLACGTINLYEAEVCKDCQCTLLVDVDQDDEIMSIDPMEAAVNDAVSRVREGDDMVAQILREQAEEAKKIVAKEHEKEERRKTRQANPKSVSTKGARFGTPDPQASRSHGFALGGGEGEHQAEADKMRHSGRFGSTDDVDEKALSAQYGFKIGGQDKTVYDEDEKQGKFRKPKERFGVASEDKMTDPTGKFKIRM